MAYAVPPPTMESPVTADPAPPDTQGTSPAATDPKRSRGGDDGGSGGGFGYILRHQSFVVIVVALAAALVIGAILIRYQGVNPWYAYETIFREALLTENGLTRTLIKTTPLVLTGLAVVLPLRVGLFNIGGQGQFVISAAMAGWAAYATRETGFLALIIAIVVGLLTGAIWASIAGLLKTSRGVHEVISTIMLNNIALGIIWWMVTTGPAVHKNTSQIPMTGPLDEAAYMPVIAGIPLGFVIAVLLALACSWMLTRTTMGFRFDTVGKNKFAAGYAGIPIARVILMAMAFAGALAGLAGAMEVTGTMHHFEPAIGGTLGFDGITIALLARSNPIWTIPAAFLVGILRTGAAGLQFATGIAPEIVDLLLALILLFVSIPVLGKWIFRSRADKVEASSTSWGN